MKAQVKEIRIGTIKPYGPDGELSAYCKHAVPGPVVIGPLGLVGDEHADPENHGGTDKAILHYAFDHYESWRNEQPALIPLLEEAGAFGENISTQGMTEDQVCLGDRFRLGTATVEISQGRQPCWKLGHRFQSPAMLGEVIKKARGGWYYRVIEAGSVSPGDTIELVDRPCPEWTVARLIEQLLGGRHDPPSLQVLADQPLLAISWRDRARVLLKKAGR